MEISSDEVDRLDNLISSWLSNMTRKGAKGSEIGVGVRTSQGIAKMFSVERQFFLDAGRWT